MSPEGYCKTSPVDLPEVLVMNISIGPKDLDSRIRPCQPYKLCSPFSHQAPLYIAYRLLAFSLGTVSQEHGGMHCSPARKKCMLHMKSLWGDLTPVRFLLAPPADTWSNRCLFPARGGSARRPCSQFSEWRTDGRIEKEGSKQGSSKPGRDAAKSHLALWPPF